MRVIGLTGSIGMGKSTAAEHLRRHGLVVVDADALVHELYSGAAVAPIQAAFPGTSKDGVIDRQALSQRVVGEPEALRRLEAIVHPLVRAEERARLQAAQRSGAAAAVLEVPLLLETGGDALVDVVVLVSAPAEIQRQRVLARPGMSEAKLAAILARQLPDAQKRERAHVVIDTRGSLEATHRQLDEFLAGLARWPERAYEEHWARG